MVTGFKKYVNFEGKRFTYFISRPYKTTAETTAENLRKQGWNARIIRLAPIARMPWGVYRRRGA